MKKSLTNASIQAPMRRGKVSMILVHDQYITSHLTIVKLA